MRTGECEEWNGQTTAWYRRAHIATRVLDSGILHTDAWFVTLTKLTEYYFGLATVHLPEIESVEHAVHPYIYHRKMRTKDYNRIRAGVQTYMNAPCLKSDRCRVNYKTPDKLELWRKRTVGPLAGWYASLALHKRCFVTYSEAVEAVPHQGDAQAYPYELTMPDGEQVVTLWIPDSGEDIAYIRLCYLLRDE